MINIASSFQNADTELHIDKLISCLSAISTHPFFREVKQESIRLLDLMPHDIVLELGCGTGEDARYLTGLAGRSGMVLGTDISSRFISHARKEGTKEYTDTARRIHPHYMLMDGRYLGFPDASIDAVREDRALQHIRNPEQVVSEMIRVLKPGGRFVAFEPDWEACIISHPDRELTRKIQNFWTDSFMNGWIGRDLYGICKRSGLEMVQVIPKTAVFYEIRLCEEIFDITGNAMRTADAGIISRPEAAGWSDRIRRLSGEGSFLLSFTGFLVSGIKKL